jgi:hypothetical protein
MVEPRRLFAVTITDNVQTVDLTPFTQNGSDANGNPLIEPQPDSEVLILPVSGVLQTSFTLNSAGSESNYSFALFRDEDGDQVVSPADTNVGDPSLATSFNLTAGTYLYQVNPVSFNSDQTIVTVRLQGPTDTRPTIAVSGNNAPIANNDQNPSITDLTDFGSAAVGQASVTRQFVVRNDGAGPLTVGNVSVPTGFAVVTDLPNSIAAGDSATFSVALGTATAGTFGGNVTFTTTCRARRTFCSASPASSMGARPRRSCRR